MPGAFRLGDTKARIDKQDVAGAGQVEHAMYLHTGYHHPKLRPRRGRLLVCADQRADGRAIAEARAGPVGDYDLGTLSQRRGQGSLDDHAVADIDLCGQGNHNCLRRRFRGYGSPA